MKRINLARIVTAVVGAAFLAIGIAGGELYSVLRKAIIICLECIGIG